MLKCTIVIKACGDEDKLRSKLELAKKALEDVINTMVEMVLPEVVNETD